MKLPLLAPSRGCSLCDLHFGCTSPGVPTIHLDTSLPPGQDTPALLFLGQNPGVFEDRAGEPFVGRSGHILRTAYVHGLKFHTRCSIYLGNAARCMTPSNARPPAFALKSCLPHLTKDLLAISIEHSRPVPTKNLLNRTRIVLLGAVALAAFYRHALGLKPPSLTDFFSHHQGSNHTDVNGVPVQLFTTYHPAYCLRRPPEIRKVAAHLQLVSDSLDGVLASPTKPTITPPRAPRKDSP